MLQFRDAWDHYREWLGDERWQDWVKHMAMLDARSLLWKRRKASGTALSKQFKKQLSKQNYTLDKY